MSKPFDDALRDRQTLISMGETEGWRVLCLRHAELLSDLTLEMHDVRKTSKEQAEILRQARAIIEERFSPKALISNLLYRIDGVVKNEKPKPPHFSDQQP